jgi:hypothetical protein
MYDHHAITTTTTTATTAGMLRTLDPYTEFENVEQALELQESVSGQYGGVGLVISGDRLPAIDKRTGKGTSKGGIVPPPAIPSRGIQVSSVVLLLRLKRLCIHTLLLCLSCSESSSSENRSAAVAELVAVVVCVAQQSQSHTIAINGLYELLCVTQSEHAVHRIQIARYNASALLHARATGRDWPCMYTPCTTDTLCCEACCKRSYSSRHLLLLLLLLFTTNCSQLPGDLCL